MFSCFAVSFFAFGETDTYAQNTSSVARWTLTEDVLRSQTNDGTRFTKTELDELNNFITNKKSWLNNFFLKPSFTGKTGLISTMQYIAFQIKNVIIFIAVIFLIIGVLTLLFSDLDATAAKKWRNNIIWVSVGIIIMQLAFSAWSVLLMRDSAQWGIGSALAWDFWATILAPIIGMIQMLAGFVFIVMMIYAFYTIVTSGGDESGRKKGINMVVYSVVGFILLQVPKLIVNAFYKNLPTCSISTGYGMTACPVKSAGELSDFVAIIGKVIQWANGLLTVICVVLVLYAGFLILTSRGEEEKLKKAKKIGLYIVIGLILLLLSHAIFRFFILQQ